MRDPRITCRFSRRGWLAGGAAALTSGRLFGFAGREFWDLKDPDDWETDDIDRLFTRSPWAKEISGHFKGTVVWESAKPIRLAVRHALPADFGGMYVLSVGGLPLVPLRPRAGRNTPRLSQAALDGVRKTATLQLRGRDPMTAAICRQILHNSNVFHFGFPKQALEISEDERAILFTITVEKMVVTTKFRPREMLYRGELAL
jgi:hypothetical protein